MKTFYVYMMTNRTNSTIYIGMTSDLIKRVYEHKTGVGNIFTKRYNINKLVYFEQYDSPEAAATRELQLKKGNRAR